MALFHRPHGQVKHVGLDGIPSAARCAAAGDPQFAERCRRSKFVDRRGIEGVFKRHALEHCSVERGHTVLVGEPGPGPAKRWLWRRIATGEMGHEDRQILRQWDRGSEPVES